jgi:FdhD protein
MQEPLQTLDRYIWSDGQVGNGIRAVPEETAIALTYNGVTHAVMMGTPQDLDDFAIGFSLGEGIVASSDEIISLDIVDLDDGIELRIGVPPERADRVGARRGQIAGSTGRGQCGVESIAAALRPAAFVAYDRSFSAYEIMDAMRRAALLQKINMETRAMHAAAFWTPARGIVALREDVGRHNALDKLAGALARGAVNGSKGVVLLTSRVSIEMVQKTAVIGAPMMVSVSAPTALAVRMADVAGITLAAIARADGFEIFTHPRRVLGQAWRSM